ncbi:MAG: carbon storage regulator [Ancrocorticia sp.]|nr:carbon storage regulator [Ancrocorticia sp.]MCI2198864.1 carbon storage regulator [Ancrocorticia sp.]
MLSRRVGEKIVIGDDIIITVVDAKSETVRIGIEAPRDIQINRAEVRETAEANKQAACADNSVLQSLRKLTRPA